jgi:hypothetical protein
MPVIVISGNVQDEAPKRMMHLGALEIWIEAADKARYAAKEGGSKYGSDCAN